MAEPTRKAVRPTRRIFTLTQGYHDSVVNGVVVDRRARDLSPRGVPERYWLITGCLAGKIIKIHIDKINPQKSFFDYQVYDGTIHRNVHCKPVRVVVRNGKNVEVPRKVGEKFLKGEVIGRLVVWAKTHTHYSIRTPIGKPVWQDTWYKKHDLQPKEWWKPA